MARRTLSMQGRILAAGVSVAVGGALVGFMAAGDHTADASATTTPAVSGSSNDTGSATPFDRGFDDDGAGVPVGNSDFPQPQTRTSGS